MELVSIVRMKIQIDYSEFRMNHEDCYIYNEDANSFLANIMITFTVMMMKAQFD